MFVIGDDDGDGGKKGNMVSVSVLGSEILLVGGTIAGVILCFVLVSRQTFVSTGGGGRERGIWRVEFDWCRPGGFACTGDRRCHCVWCRILVIYILI